MNISYTRQGDYLLPNLILKEKEQFNIRKYGLLKLHYIKKNKQGLYTELLMSNKLNEYLHNLDVDIEIQEENLIQQLAEKEKITEELKDIDQMLWVRKMNNIRNRVEEIILKKCIYV